MIIDSLQNSVRYEQLHPLFKLAFDYLKSIDLTGIEAQKVVLQGDDLFVMISDSALKPAKEALLETHNNYIDIQLPISKMESFGWKKRSSCLQATEAYNQEKDICFYYDKPDTYFDLQAGDFVIFFPEDAHAPCIGTDTLKKIVIKVRV